MNNAVTEGSTLVGIEMVTSQLTASYLANGVNEVPTIEIFEPVLIRVMGVGPTMKVGSGRVLDPVLITSILKHHQLT